MQIRSIASVLIFSVLTSGCSAALAGLTALDERRERAAATHGPEELDAFEPGERVLIRFVDGTERDATVVSGPDERGAADLVVRSGGDNMTVAPDSVEWVRERQKSYVIHAFVFGALIDGLAIILGRRSGGGFGWEFGP
jgi:hypothetical protein